MKVILLSWTQNPVETLAKVWYSSRTDDPLPSDNDIMWKDPELFRKIVASKIPVAEHLDFVFLLEGIPVSLREQLVRHRIGVHVGDRLGCDLIPDLANSSFWAQSMRALDMRDFKTYIPQSIQDNPAVLKEFEGLMSLIRTEYTYMVDKCGIPAEDARAMLPLCTTHRMTWKLNLSAILHIIGKRSCWIAQLGQWGPLIRGMVSEMAEKVDPIFNDLICPPCLTVDGTYCECLFPGDSSLRHIGQDPLPSCPLYDAHEGLREVLDKPTGDKARFLQKMREDFQEFWKRDVDTGKRL